MLKTTKSQVKVLAPIYNINESEDGIIEVIYKLIHDNKIKLRTFIDIRGPRLMRVTACELSDLCDKLMPNMTMEEKLSLNKRIAKILRRHGCRIRKIQGKAIVVFPYMIRNV